MSDPGDVHAQMQRNIEMMNASLEPEQADITWGSKWVRLVADWPDGGLVVFGHVYTPEEFVSSEMTAGADEQEIEYGLAHRRVQFARGLVWGPCYSVVEPGGEFSAVHKAVLWPISETVFEAASMVMWEVGSLPVETAVALLSIRTA